MGASSWLYCVPYQENVTLALKALQEQIFMDEWYVANWWYECIPQAYWDDKWNIMRNIHQSWIEAAGIELNWKGYARIELSWKGYAQAVLDELARVLAAKQVVIELPKPPQTIEELLQRTDADGTHSILDIAAIASQPGFRMATPLSQQEHLTFLGTEKPTRATVEAVLAQQREPREKGLETIRGRWQAVYFTVYKDEKPDEICFCGLSGD